MLPRFQNLILASLALIVFGVYAGRSYQPLPLFAGYSELKWAKLDGWSEKPAGIQNTGIQNPGIQNMDPPAIAFTPRQSFERWAVAVSEPVTPAGRRIIFEGRGPRPPGRFSIQAETEESKQDPPKFRPRVKTAANWTDIAIDLPEDFIGKKVRFTVFAEQPKMAENSPRSAFHLRSRLGFQLFDPDTANQGRAPIKPAIAGAGALFLLFLLLRPFSGAKPCSNFCLFILYFAAGEAVFSRNTLFFHWDEWDVLLRFAAEGWSTALKPHNEHFIPLFFGIYRLESLLFGDNYLLYTALTAAVHALNVLLLVNLLRRLTPESASAKPAVFQAIGVLYLLNVLHSEVLQWAFEISIAAAQTFLWLCCHQLLTYIEAGSARRLIYAVLCAAAAPLFFGNGLALPLQAAALLSLPVLFNPAGSLAAVSSGLRFKRLALAVFVLLLPCFGVFTLYKQFTPQSASAEIGRKITENFDQVGSYLFVGSQFGAVLRSTGLYPTLQIETSPQVLHDLQAAFPRTVQLLPAIAPDLLFAWAGLILSLAVLLFGLLLARRRPEFRFYPLNCFISGQLFLLATLLLPALGRWHFGAFQSLSPRYHYQTLPGVFIILLPVLLPALQALTEKPSLKISASFTTMLLMLYFFFNFIHLGNFDYFTEKGRRSRQYVDELKDWGKRRIDLSRQSGIVPPYEGGIAPLAGMFPVPDEPLSPSIHPDQAYAVLNSLNGADYPALPR